MNKNYKITKIGDLPNIVIDNFLEEKFYKKLKENFPDLNNMKNVKEVQPNRKQIEINNYDNKYYIKLFNIFNSLEFKRKHFNYFREYYTKKNLFLLNLNELDKFKLSFIINESNDNYENPWHVDSRKRIMMFLFYLGDEKIKLGGGTELAKHKEIDINKYYRHPDITNIEKIYNIKPINNRLLIIPSIPNSYHKGSHLIGNRKFIYAAYDSPKNYAWKIDKNWYNGIGWNEPNINGWIKTRDEQNKEKKEIPIEYI